METKDFVAILEDKFASRKSADDLLAGIKGLDGKLAALSDIAKTSAMIDGQAKAAVVEDPKAELEAKSAFDDIMKFEFWGIPIGEAAVGGFVAILASELVDGFAATWEPWQRGLLKFGVAGASAMWGKKILGSTGSKAVALLLAFDALRDMTPIDSWADQIAEKISGTVTDAGLAGPMRSGKMIDLNNKKVPEQKSNSSFYTQAFGGA
jgi:hypothetical protein